MQVVTESRKQCGEALQYLAEIRQAFPEVLQAIKTKQLAQEILLYQEERIGDIAKTGKLSFSYYEGHCCLTRPTLIHQWHREPAYLWHG